MNTHKPLAMSLQIPIKHGGNLREAAKKYQIPLTNWIDLSTGINPNGWQPPEIPAYVWQRLPEEEDGLQQAAQQYYGVTSLLAIAGSQAAIQALPYCRSQSKVGIISPAYAEYNYCWHNAGHEVIEIDADHIEAHISELDVLIVINPNNPDTHFHSLPTLRRWQQQLMQVGGWLIVDEAFMDSTPEHSLLQYDMSTMPNLIVLRSLGKFFGLAGLRLGFMVANPTILAQLQHSLGTWPISNPSRYLGKKALLDTVWQQQTRLNLKQKSQQLQQLLQQHLHQYSDQTIVCTSLFCYIKSHNASLLHTQLAQYGIWIRYFAKPQAVRIGLPQSEQQFRRLLSALKQVSD